MEEGGGLYCSENMTKQIGSTLIGNKQTSARDINGLCSRISGIPVKGSLSDEG